MTPVDSDLLTDAHFAHDLLESSARGDFVPPAPISVAETKVPLDLIESLILKFLLNRGTASGHEMSAQVALPFRPTEELLRTMKAEQLVTHRSSAGIGDYRYELTAAGFDRAERAARQTTYFGACPVLLEDYIQSVQQQSLTRQHPTPQDLLTALSDLVLPPALLNQVGQAVRAGRSMFLFGSPGNGKTSIAQRICGAFGKTIWVPRALLIEGDVVRLFDPSVHRPIERKASPNIDSRWIQIERPTVVAGGELTLENLEMMMVGSSGIVEAPLQLKSNCGVLVIDDFGRQRISATALLNRWIVPLETHVDYLNMPSGKKIALPFEQMVVFSTNLAPEDLVDEAFLRRIPYKVHAPDPTEKDFRRVFEAMAKREQIEFNVEAYIHLVKKHYLATKRPFRYCHARDLLKQIRIMCEFHDRPVQMTPRTIDLAVTNYFVSMGRT